MVAENPNIISFQLTNPGAPHHPQINGRIARKRIHVRIEHVQHSKCREDFLKRREANDAAKAEAKKAGKTVSTKRVIPGPRDGFTLENVKTEILTPIPYDSECPDEPYTLLPSALLMFVTASLSIFVFQPFGPWVPCLSLVGCSARKGGATVGASVCGFPTDKEKKPTITTTAQLDLHPQPTTHVRVRHSPCATSELSSIFADLHFLPFCLQLCARASSTKLWLYPLP